MEKDNYQKCKDCLFFDEDNIPADCKKGHGKVAFMRTACSDFKLNEKASSEDGNH